ncbi:MAG: cupin [Pseudomonadota bacterium]
MTAPNLIDHPVHLGLGATALQEPAFTGDMAWYEAYAHRHEADGNEGRLVSMHRFNQSWGQWEMHPNGSELVICVTGRLRLLQERPDEAPAVIDLDPGDYAINAPGVWHTADIDGEATALFITSGIGTEHRPR